MEAKRDSNQKKAGADRDELKAIMNAFQDKVDSNQAKKDSNQEKAKASTAKLEEKMEETIECQTKHLKAIHERMMAKWNTHQEMTEIDPDTEMMQSTEEHQEIPTEDTAVMPVGEPRKQHSVRYLAAESHQKRKDRTQGNHGSRKKSAVARRKVSHHASGMAEKETHSENGDPGKLWTVQGIDRHQNEEEQ
jgi:hypothetical protein